MGYQYSSLPIIPRHICAVSMGIDEQKRTEVQLASAISNLRKAGNPDRVIGKEAGSVPCLTAEAGPSVSSLIIPGWVCRTEVE